MKEHHIRVQRTARYHVLGDPARAKVLWIVLHGYGQLARYFLNKFAGLRTDLAIIAPEGLSRYYMDDGHQRVGASWMTREDREEEIRDQRDYLDDLVDVLRRTNPTAPINVLGFSQGVATACRWSLAGRTRIQQLVLWAGSIPPEPGPKELNAGWAHLEIDIVLGTEDPYISDNELQALAARLDLAGVPHQVHRFTGGHALEPVLLGRLMRY